MQPEQKNNSLIFHYQVLDLEDHLLLLFLVFFISSSNYHDVIHTQFLIMGINKFHYICLLKVWEAQLYVQGQQSVALLLKIFGNPLKSFTHSILRDFARSAHADSLVTLRLGKFWQQLNLLNQPLLAIKGSSEPYFWFGCCWKSSFSGSHVQYNYQHLLHLF